MKKSDEFTLEYIRDNPQDFKICDECNSINEYENESCVKCNSDKFREHLEVEVEVLAEAKINMSEHSKKTKIKV